MEKIFKVPKGYTTESYLKELIFKGLNELYGENLIKDIEDRAEYEIQLIESADMSDYFLVAWDVVNYAKTHDIPVGIGCGSLGNSLVAYALKITEIDSIKYDLPCERFFRKKNDAQIFFDIDFGCASRVKIIEYIVKKYGANNVCSLICQNENNSTKLFIKPESLKIKLKRNQHTHVAGVIISTKPLNKIIPFADIKSHFKAFSDNVYIGYRFNFLELRYLNLIDNTVKEIKSDFDINNIPVNDKETFDMISNGETKGVFNFESKGMLKLLKVFKPKNIEDISSLIALYRPAPLELELFDQFVENSKNPHYINSKFEQILKSTYGTIIYQEQLMQILQFILNCSLFEAHEIRRKISKLKEIEDLEQNFINNALKQDISKETAEELFKKILSHICCYFNKAHSLAYAIMTYRLAYLKCHYPKEFAHGYERSDFSEPIFD